MPRKSKHVPAQSVHEKILKTLEDARLQRGDSRIPDVAPEQEENDEEPLTFTEYKEKWYGEFPTSESRTTASLKKLDQLIHDLDRSKNKEGAPHMPKHSTKER